MFKGDAVEQLFSFFMVYFCLMDSKALLPAALTVIIVFYY